jgi:type III pantothenate kinase
VNLTIDIGNSLTKIIVFEDTAPVFKYTTRGLTLKYLEKLLKIYPIEDCMLSSVVEVDKKLLERLKKLSSFEKLTASTKIPLKNFYKTPSTLGNDRLANVIAAGFLFPGKNVLVIDAGTCVKYDFLNKNNAYLGGSITPGLEMRFKALHHFTGKLPLVKPVGFKILTGRTTVEAIESGVIIGMVEEMKGFIHRYKIKYKSLIIILTGGDASRFERELNLSIFAAADLVNIGLNEIIRQKVN